MRFNECEELLRIITSFDRRPFPEGAAAIWYEVLRNTDYEDAKAAVVEYFNGSDDKVPTLLPGRVRIGAQRFKAIREASSRPAIEAPPPKPAAMTRSAAFEAAWAEIQAATARASQRVHARDPELREYQHRKTSLTRVA